MTVSTAPANHTSSHPSLLSTYLNNVRIVMVNTTLPANIGSAARAMYTMGLTDLVVVNPKLPIDADSIAHAAGAQQILHDCLIVESLEDALASSDLVFAASSRQRHIPRPVVTPDAAAQLILTRHAANQASSDNNTQVAVLFGREDRGLTNDELAVADYHIQIDANPDYPVLNVASAVQVISAFFYSRFLQHTLALQRPVLQQPVLQLEASSSATEVEMDHYHSCYHTDVDCNSNRAEIDIFLRQIWDSPAINQEQKNSLQRRIIALMYDLELVESVNASELRDLPSRLSRLLSRLQLDQKEYELVSAIIAKLKRQLTNTK